MDESVRIISLLRKFGLLVEHQIPDHEMSQLINHDKKKTGEQINFVFTEGIGKAVVNKITINEVIDFYKNFRDKKLDL